MKYRIILSAVAVSVLSAGALSAQTPVKQQPTKASTTHTMQPSKTMVSKPVTPKASRKVELKEAQPGLLSQATVNVDDALATALKSRSGTVTSERLEKRGDQLDYVFTIKGKKVHHVIVDAKTGKVVRPQAHAQKTPPKKSSGK